MKSASMTWAFSLLLAVCLTPNLRGIAPRTSSARPPVALVQTDPPVALPGSADVPAPGMGDENGSEAGQTEGADPDAATPPDAGAAPEDQGAGANGGMTDPNAGVDRPQDNPDAQLPQTNMQPPADENDDGSSAEQRKQSSDNDADQDAPVAPADDDN
ncbi:MAG TPA: hypothetical protein VKT27_15370 [Candidatus Binataceae bacterium]|nr:hypothetical protein [Candidatus Binataceae bacterium]